MKNLTTKMTIAAAAFVAAAGIASAQTMEANIPFAFRASGKVLPAGTYKVQLLREPSGNPQFVIRGQESNDAVLSIGYPEGDAKKAWQTAGNAVLSFQCGISRCALSEVWMGGANAVYKVPTPSLGRDEPRHTAEVTMHSTKGD